MKKIYYIDTYSVESHHEMINACLLKMCSKMAQSLDYYACHSSCEMVLKKAQIDSSKLILHSIWLPQFTSRWGIIFRYLVGMLQNIRMILLIPRDSVLFFNFNNVLFFAVFQWFHKLRGQKVFICCHGELEMLLSDKKAKGYWHKFLKWNVCRFFLKPNRNLNKNLKFIVLGDVILKNLQPLLSESLMSHFFSIDHPYIFQKLEKNLPANKGYLRLGTVGVMSKLKGADIFKSIAEKIDRNKVHLSIAGSVDVHYRQEFKKLGIQTHQGYLPRQEFDKEIQELDYILFLYPFDSYKLIASGAIFDAICWEKPVIALKNDYFQYLFDKYEPFGYLVNSVDELIEMIERLSDRSINTDFSDSFRNLKTSLSPDKIGTELQQYCDSCFC